MTLRLAYAAALAALALTTTPAPAAAAHAAPTTSAHTAAAYSVLAVSRATPPTTDPTDPAPPAAEPADPAPPATDPADAEPVAAPKRGGDSWVAKPLTPTAVLAQPRRGARRVWVAQPATPYNGQPTRLLVLGERVDAGGERWLRVRLPSRPNDAAGWLPRDRVALSRTPFSIEVRLDARTITVRRDGRVLRRARAVIGRPSTPTPRGLFAVYEIVAQRDPRGFLGPWALHLTAHSEVLESFGGGPGRAAIHGRDGASLRDPLGSAASNGCVRVPNAFVSWLARTIAPGTPVWVRR